VKSGGTRTHKTTFSLNPDLGVDNPKPEESQENITTSEQTYKIESKITAYLFPDIVVAESKHKTKGRGKCQPDDIPKEIYDQIGFPRPSTMLEIFKRAAEIRGDI